MTTNRAKKRPSRAPKRTPISGHRDILSVKGVPDGWIPRWVNDVSNRIERFLAAGWEFVTDKEVTVGDRTVNSGTDVGTCITKNVGSGVVAYLMATPKEFYNEDKAASQALIDETEAAILNHKEEGQYGKVSISRK